MADTAVAAAAAGEPRSRWGRRSDGGLTSLGFLGDFARGHALFSVYRLGPDRTRYPNGPCEYLVDCDDGVGPHEVCRFDDADFAPRWRGSWNGDPWCPWLMKRAKEFIAELATGRPWPGVDRCNRLVAFPPRLVRFRSMQHAARFAASRRKDS